MISLFSRCPRKTYCIGEYDHVCKALGTMYVFIPNNLAAFTDEGYTTEGIEKSTRLGGPTSGSRMLICLVASRVCIVRLLLNVDMTRPVRRALERRTSVA